MQFNVLSWKAVSAYHQSESDWRAWFSDSSVSLEEQSLDLSIVPVMQRRRLSKIARCFFAAAGAVLSESGVEHCPIVFVSHHGEFNRNLSLWREYIVENVISPTSFALSVHNAMAGQWSLIRGDMSEMTAISAHHNGLELACVEAASLLSEGVSHVLVALVEEPPILDEQDVEKAPFPFALAMLLSAGDEFTLDYCPEPLGTEKPPAYYASALSWIEHRLKQTQHWQVPDKKAHWCWQNRGGVDDCLCELGMALDMDGIRVCPVRSGRDSV